MMCDLTNVHKDCIITKLSSYRNDEEMSKTENLSKKNEQEKRVRSGIRSGLVGLITNIILAIIKVAAGLMAGSVSILADAVNSIGDSASGVLTIGGFYIANKPADKEHPYGHQRAEYISGLFIAIIILIVGLEFLSSSVQKILNPTSVVSSRLVLLLLFLSVLTKAGLAICYHNLDKKMTDQSNIVESLVKDSINDILMTSVIIISYFIEIQFGWYIDGYVGAGVALFIVYSGITSIIDSSNDLLGTRPDPELVHQMQEVLNGYDNIVGYHDLLIHKYGPNKIFVTVDIEIDSRWSLVEAHKVLDEIERDFEEKFNIKTVCHLDPIVLHDEEQNEIYSFIKKTLKSYDKDFHFHDFQVMEEEQEIHFDVVIPNSVEISDEELYNQIENDFKNRYKSYKLVIKFDHNYILEE